jgi:putative MATE family efflux protein
VSAAPAPQRRSIALDDSRPIWQSLGIFLIPLMLSNVLQSLGQSANAVYLGHMVGVRSLAAVSAIFPLVFFLVSFLIGLGAGSSALIGQAYGAREIHKVKAIAGTALGLSIGLGILVAIFGALFAEPLLRVLAVPADILPTSVSYARIVFLGLPLFFAYLMYTTFLRGVGDTKTPFIVLIMSTALTFALTPIFINGWLGMPRLQTNGAAVGNILATVVALAFLLVLLARQDSPLKFDRETFASLRPQWKLAKTIARIGIPTSLNLAMISLSEIALLAFVNRFGSTALAAYGAVNQIVSYVQFPAISIGIASSIFGAQAIGAGRTDRIPKIVRSAILLNYFIEGVLVAIVYLFATSIISAFVTNKETIDIARGLLYITLWSYAIFGNSRVLSAIMISSGTVVWPTAISIICIWAVEVPVAYVLMGKYGLDGVWVGYPVSYIVALLFQTLYYFFIWRRRPLQRLV